MGGNAFPQAERLTKREYRDAYKGAENAALALGFRAAVPHSYGAKDSFGDVDMLVSNKHHRDVDLLLAKLKPLAQIKNPSGYNLLLENEDGKKYQLDLNFTPEETFSFAFGYFSFNDLGNLIGRIAHRQGLKFGHDGLWYVYRKGSKVLDEIRLTTDFETALKYLGFDTEKYYARFYTLESMFAWVERSKYFDPCAFPLEHRNHKGRVRDAKRPNYNKFLAWLGERYDLSNYVKADKEAYLKAHLMAWPELGKRMEAADRLDDLKRRYKEKCGGTRVMELTGLEGKELGELMQEVRSHLPLSEETVAKSQEALDSEIMFLYNQYSTNKD